MTDEQKRNLVKLAKDAREKAYAPYSNYQVGAALLTKTGLVFSGCNVENAALGHTICAERTAILKAVSEGHRTFEGIAVVTKDGGTPCGSCRQVMREFAGDLTVIVADEKGATKTYTLNELLPHSFGPDNLKKT